MIKCPLSCLQNYKARQSLVRFLLQSNVMACLKVANHNVSVLSLAKHSGNSILTCNINIPTIVSTCDCFV